MGFREAVLLGFVLLLSLGNVCAATQNWLNFSTNETLNQIPPERVTRSLQLPRARQTTDHWSNLIERSDLPVRNPVSYRLKIYQLRNPAAEMQTPQNPQGSEARKPTSEQLEPRETRELLKLPGQGPDLYLSLKQEPKVLVKYEQWLPVPAASVAAHCGEREVTVEVKQNFLGNGQLIRPSDLTLGGCAVLDTADHILQFQTELQSCGSTMTMTEDALIYSFSLMYSPTPIGNTVVLKTNPTQVVIECHYRRRHYVSSNAVGPTWKPFASNMLAEQQLHFSLRLMTEDWQSQRPSNVYFPGDVMHIEAAILQGHHIPLRIYVDSCVATTNPDPSSQPRYPFITNHGCLSDAKLTGAKSYFMQRSQEDKLHFQLKAFRFHQDHRNSRYITCHLKATALSVPIDSQHKVCSFLIEAKRWVASGGDNKVCSCCETSCKKQRRKRGLATDAELPLGLQWEGTAALGPILLEENILEEELSEPSLLRMREATGAASYSLIALLYGAGAALAVVLLVFMGAIICSGLRKPTAHTVCT
ncbi:zona pellucida sperm-binding protein 3-like [Morone saxatilis]|uniref:zona pellucida sperm-binding protein 3-like n=1 Tax=Morone saxatilis TaxID=34816 RepID=UPI0015E20F1B|nr:zona pellucida sperm-binding protein 3-like [Morone saxatilis]